MNTIYCNIIGCSLAETCVRRKNYDLLEPDTVSVIRMINPKNSRVAGECPHYLAIGTKAVAWGFIEMLDSLPHRMLEDFRYNMERRFGHTIYYEYRRGLRPINAELQQEITDQLRSSGYEGDIWFDRYSEA